jgi:hypothetical protein
MAQYTAYLLDDQGNILSRAEIEAGDDAAAVAAGQQLAGAHSTDTPDPARGVEIWRDRILVFSSHPRLG